MPGVVAAEAEAGAGEARLLTSPRDARPEVVVEAARGVVVVLLLLLLPPAMALRDWYGVCMYTIDMWGERERGEGGYRGRSAGQAGFEELVVARCSLRRLGVACGCCVWVVCAAQPNSQKLDVKTGRGRFPESSWGGFFCVLLGGTQGRIRAPESAKI